MTQGALELDQIEDYVDIEQDTAWLAFSHSGDRIKIDCRVEDDWVDEKIFGTFVELLEESDPSKTFIYYDLGGQSCILGCVSNDEFEVLKGYGINFVPLS
jgi:hypothetical protein